MADVNEILTTALVLVGSGIIVGLCIKYLIVEATRDKERAQRNAERKKKEAAERLEWGKKKQDIIKKLTEIAEKNPGLIQGLTKEELKETYIRHYPEDSGHIGRYLEERHAGHAGQIIRYENRYNGSNWVLCILLCIGILPGLLYYLLVRETIPIYEDDKEKDV